jgi:dipeptidyl aminopeptidase/acylaminoacyl peptidase
MKRLSALLALLLVAAPALADAPKKRPLTVDDLFRFRRVSDPQVSPDGKTVVYVVGTVDLAANRTSANVWLAQTSGGSPCRLTTTAKSDRHPRWSPDGKHILFESTRSGETQLWVIDVGGGEARQLTTLSSEARNGLWSRDGKQIAFVSAVYPEYSDRPFKESDALNRKRKEEVEKNPVKAKVFTHLFFRHWDEWVEGKRQHLFVMAWDGGKGGEPRDVTPGNRDAYPTSDTFSVGDDFTFSPDGTHLVFTAVPAKNEAWSTNYDICRVPVTGGVGAGSPRPWECLTKDNPAADGAPQFSPDGKLLAYRAQRRAGFESDRWELMVVETDASGTWTGKARSLTPKFDSWVEGFVWRPDGGTILFTAADRAEAPIYLVRVDGAIMELPLMSRDGRTGTNNSLTCSRQAGYGQDRVAWLRMTVDRPAEVYVGGIAHDKSGQPLIDGRNKSRANDALLAQLDLPRPESVTVKGAGGTPMQMWVLKPPGFDPAKKWPLAYLVHGGPQGAWEDGWSYRWNPEVWAAQGYVVALPNPRGSTGFGQKYVDEISGDWGGKCYEDLMAGVAWLEKQPWIDLDRMAAAGASFGGYMMNWFQGHTTKFKTLITHCGVYNFTSMYALTDELWFDEWEHGGPPWAHPESYKKHSPHLYAKDFKTPMLIIHNDLDFRVPVAEGLQLFTTLQRLGVPARMINFPDEGHWVLRPANSRYWHREVFAWLRKYVPPGGR